VLQHTKALFQTFERKRDPAKFNQPSKFFLATCGPEIGDKIVFISNFHQTNVFSTNLNSWIKIKIAAMTKPVILELT
jgi:hypothetical protein